VTTRSAYTYGGWLHACRRRWPRASFCRFSAFCGIAGTLCILPSASPLLGLTEIRGLACTCTGQRDCCTSFLGAMQLFVPPRLHRSESIEKNTIYILLRASESASLRGLKYTAIIGSKDVIAGSGPRIAEVSMYSRRPRCEDRSLAIRTATLCRGHILPLDRRASLRSFTITGYSVKRVKQAAPGLRCHALQLCCTMVSRLSLYAHRIAERISACAFYHLRAGHGGTDMKLRILCCTARRRAAKV